MFNSILLKFAKDKIIRILFLVLVLVISFFVFSGVSAQLGAIKVKAGIAVSSFSISKDGTQLSITGTAHGGIYKAPAQSCPQPGLIRYNAGILVADVSNQTGGISRLTDRAEYRLDNGANGRGVVELARIQRGVDKLCSQQAGTEKEYLYSFSSLIPILDLSPGKHTLSLCSIAHTDGYDDPDICVEPEIEFTVQPPEKTEPPLSTSSLRVETRVDDGNNQIVFFDSPWRIITSDKIESDTNAPWPGQDEAQYQGGYQSGAWQVQKPGNLLNQTAEYAFTEYWKNGRCFLNCGGGTQAGAVVEPGDKVKINFVYLSSVTPTPTPTSSSGEEVGTVRIHTKLEGQDWPGTVGMGFSVSGQKNYSYSSPAAGHEAVVILQNVPVGQLTVKARSNSDGNVHALWRVSHGLEYDAGQNSDTPNLNSGETLDVYLDYLYFGRDIAWGACEELSRKAGFEFRSTQTSVPQPFYTRGFESLSGEWGYGRKESGGAPSFPRGIRGTSDIKLYTPNNGTYTTENRLDDGWNIFWVRGTVTSFGMTPGINSSIKNTTVGNAYANCGITKLKTEPSVVQKNIVKGATLSLTDKTISSSLKNLTLSKFDQTINPEVVAGWKQDGSIAYKQASGWISSIEYPESGSKKGKCENAANYQCVANPNHSFSIYTQNQPINVVLSDSVKDLPVGTHEAVIKFAGPIYIEFPRPYNVGDQISISGYGQSETELLVRLIVDNPPVSAVSCSAQPQNALVSQPVTFTGSGGNGIYSWSAPGASPSSGTGVNFITRFGLAGHYSVTISSGGQAGMCSVNILPPPSVTVTPPVGFRTASLRVEAQVDNRSNQITIFNDFWRVITPRKVEAWKNVPWPNAVGYQDGYASGSWQARRPSDEIFPNTEAEFNRIEIFIQDQKGQLKSIKTDSPSLNFIDFEVSHSDRVRVILVYQTPKKADLSCTDLQFNAVLGRKEPAPQDLFLDISGGKSDTLHEDLSIEKAEAASWLNFSPINRINIVGNTNHLEKSVKKLASVNTVGLTAREYKAKIQVQAKEVVRSPQFCNIVLRVSENEDKNAAIEVIDKICLACGNSDARITLNVRFKNINSPVMLQYSSNQGVYWADVGVPWDNRSPVPISFDGNVSFQLSRGVYVFRLIDVTSGQVIASDGPTEVDCSSSGRINVTVNNASGAQISWMVFNPDSSQLGSGSSSKAMSAEQEGIFRLDYSPRSIIGHTIEIQPVSGQLERRSCEEKNFIISVRKTNEDRFFTPPPDIPGRDPRVCSVP